MTKKELRIALIAIGALCVISLAAMIAALIHFKPIEQEFVPPAFDATAVAGELAETDELKELGWSEIYRDGMEYSAYLCGRVLADEQNTADVWFYNTGRGESWIKLRVFDAQGNVVAETGLIKPKQYIKTLQFTRPMEDGEQISFKIMGYEPDTYLSAGAVTLNTTVKAK